MRIFVNKYCENIGKQILFQKYARVKMETEFDGITHVGWPHQVNMLNMWWLPLGKHVWSAKDKLGFEKRQSEVGRTPSRGSCMDEFSLKRWDSNPDNRQLTLFCNLAVSYYAFELFPKCVYWMLYNFHSDSSYSEKNLRQWNQRVYWHLAFGWIQRL